MMAIHLKQGSNPSEFDHPIIFYLEYDYFSAKSRTISTMAAHDNSGYQSED